MMGLRMDSLHNPSVPTASSQPGSHGSSDAALYEELMMLYEQKARLQKELDALRAGLDSVCTGFAALLSG